MKNKTKLKSDFVSRRFCNMVFTASIVNINGDTLKNYDGPEGLDNFNNEVQFVETIYRCEQ